MRISVILGHPYRGSLNAAIADTVVLRLQQNGHDVRYHDLAGERFDPVIPGDELSGGVTNDPLVAVHQKEIVQADGLIVIHPNWWGQAPAILKGWIDRVLRENIAYRFSEGDAGGGVPVGLLKAKAGLVFNTSNTSEDRENEVFGDPLHRLWKDCIFSFCGIDVYDRRMFRVVADSDLSQRQKWLAEAEMLVNKYFPKDMALNG